MACIALFFSDLKCHFYDIKNRSTHQYTKYSLVMTFHKYETNNIKNNIHHHHHNDDDDDVSDEDSSHVNKKQSREQKQ